MGAEGMVRRKLTLKDKLEILVRQGRCPVCNEKLGRLEEVEFDHEWALVRGGDDSNENLRAIHADPCHKQKTFGPGGERRIHTRGSDVGEPAHERDVARAEKFYRENMARKEAGQPREKTGSIKSRGFEKKPKLPKRSRIERERMGRHRTKEPA